MIIGRDDAKVFYRGICYPLIDLDVFRLLGCRRFEEGMFSKWGEYQQS